MQWDIGLELGESGVRAATRARGVVLSVPSHCAMRGGEVIATGDEALHMLGREGRGVCLRRPIASGRLDQPALASMWIERLLTRYAGRLKKPAVALAVPPQMPAGDRSALRDAVLAHDAAHCGFLESDLAAALGAGCDVMSPEGVLMIDLGAGCISASMISYGRVAARRSLPYGMRWADEAIASALREQMGIVVGPHTAEELKHQLGSAVKGRTLYVKAAAMDMRSGFPAMVEIDAQAVERAVLPLAEAVVSLAVSVIQRSPGDLAADLIQTGVVFTGGGARLFGLERLLEERTGLRGRMAEEPDGCVIGGLHYALVEDSHGDLIKFAV